MYPSKPNTNGAGSSQDFGRSQATAPSSTSDGKHVPPATDFSYPSSNPSAPLLPSSPYNPAIPNTDPPPYSSVVAQDSGDWKNRPSTFSGGNNPTAYPPVAPNITGEGSTPGLHNQAPYPTGPTNTAPYPSYGASAQAPYPTGPGAGPQYPSTAPYPGGPDPSSGVTSQPPYYAGSGYMPGPASQAPYPMGSMPMPGPVDTERQIGFTAPVTTEPKPANFVYSTGGYHGSAVIPNQGTQQGLIYPVAPGENNTQYASTAYPQQQGQPNTIYVVQKAPERSTAEDDCCLFSCCLACCYCLCECIKLCASDS